MVGCDEWSVLYGDEMLICFLSSVTSSLASIKHISFFSTFPSFKRFILLLAFSSFKNLGMDSNPYNTHPSNFVDLLNSQQDVVFGLGEDSVHVSSSQVPLYGTPRSEDPHLGEPLQSVKKEEHGRLQTIKCSYLLG